MFVEPKNMVSRSLEKMILIAVGLTSVVLVGVPVIFHTLNTISSASDLQMATNFANSVHNATGNVDTGLSDGVTVEIAVPRRVSLSASNDSLTVLYETGDGTSKEWTRDYLHEIILTGPTSPGTYHLSINLVSGQIHIEFTKLE